jgi:putative flavoprotein involved in K+ transport
MIDRDSADILDVVVIGGGQAGLAMARQLQLQGLSFVVLDTAAAAGETWRTRWDSLTLFTPGRHSALPGLPFPGDPDAFPTKDDVADYLADYADCFGLPVRHSSRVTRLTRTDGVFVAETARGCHRSRAVVIATGPFQRPVIPASAAGFAPEVGQVHSSGYRNPAQLPSGPVLVVGGGNSGFQIAAELAAHHTVHLSIGTTAPQLPARVFGRDAFSWLHRLGIITAPTTSRLGRRLRERGGDIIIGSRTRTLARAGVRIHPRLVQADGNTAHFADGSTAAAAAVVWATGFRRDHSFIDIPGIDDSYDDGISSIEGLYFIGMPWQRTRGSALLGFVGDDAIALAPRIRDGVRAARKHGTLSASGMR